MKRKVRTGDFVRISKVTAKTRTIEMTMMSIFMNGFMERGFFYEEKKIYYFKS